MKVTIEFNLPEECNEYQAALNNIDYSKAYMDVLHVFYMYMYAEPFKTEYLTTMKSRIDVIAARTFVNPHKTYEQLKSKSIND